MSSGNDNVIGGLRKQRKRRQPLERRTPNEPPAMPVVRSVPARSENNAKASNQTPSTTKEPLQVPNDDRPTNYAVRVRWTLDDLASRRLGELRARGVKSSKVELTELLLWELDSSSAAELEERLARFRRYAPR